MTHPRETQMMLALDHADARHGDWSEQAAAFLTGYACKSGPFTGEDVTRASHGFVPEPPTSRAWGGVFQGLARRGVIRATGRYAKRGNGNAMPVWEACR
jgi:hypothetical protein